MYFEFSLKYFFNGEKNIGIEIKFKRENVIFFYINFNFLQKIDFRFKCDFDELV